MPQKLYKFHSRWIKVFFAENVISPKLPLNRNLFFILKILYLQYDPSTRVKCSEVQVNTVFILIPYVLLFYLMLNVEAGFLYSEFPTWSTNLFCNPPSLTEP
jgi:hypothetical protein